MSQDCSDLFISEYIEGPGQNNAIEIYNPTNGPISLAGYTVNRYSNGDNTDPETWQLSGVINAGDVFVVGNGQVDSVWAQNSYWSLPVDPVFFSILDEHCNGDYDANSTFYFNGNDAMTLEYNGNIVDVFGKVGENPGDAWTCDTTGGFTSVNSSNWLFLSERWWSKRKTLVRKPSIKKGVTMNPILFNPTLEYDSLADGTYTGMGTHICDCNTTSIFPDKKPATLYSIYPNPVIKGEMVFINKGVKNIKVIDILGSMVLSLNTNEIPTYYLEKGIYIVSIKFSDGNVEQNKLIVK